MRTTASKSKLCSSVASLGTEDLILTISWKSFYGVTAYEQGTNFYVEGFIRLTVSTTLLQSSSMTLTPPIKLKIWSETYP